MVWSCDVLCLSCLCTVGEEKGESGGIGEGIDLADPLNLLKIHLVVFFGYSKYNGLININKEQDYVTKKVNYKNEKPALFILMFQELIL